MATKRRCLTQPLLENISKILGDTNKGLTGSEIGHLLVQSKFQNKMHLKYYYCCPLKLEMTF